MTLKEVCELADACGLETVGEAVMNAELHYDALVLIDDMDREFEELYREVKALGPEWESVSIYTIVKKMCCANCKKNYPLEKYDYSGKGCTHTPMDGHICMAFANEGNAIWMVGDDPDSWGCEVYEPKEDA